MNMKEIISKQSNKGLSLIELIVSMLILGMVTGIVVILVISSSNSYNIVYNEVNMQTEADVALNYIDEIAVEAKGYATSNFTNALGKQIASLCILAPGEAGDSDDYYYIVWHEANKNPDDNDNKLRFCKFKKDLTPGETDPITWYAPSTRDDGIDAIDINSTLYNNGFYGKTDNFLAKYVTDFKAVVPTDPHVFPMLQIKIGLKFADSKYSATKNIASRNL